VFDPKNSEENRHFVSPANGRRVRAIRSRHLGSRNGRELELGICRGRTGRNRPEGRCAKMRHDDEGAHALALRAKSDKDE
jgi:hypothetical protein